MSSVSVGKPAMMSAPNTTSGRKRRTSRQNMMASLRVCRRFMRFEDHVVAGLQGQVQMRHQTLFAGERVEQIAVGFH